MAVTDAVKLAIYAGLSASKHKLEAKSKPSVDPAIGIAMLAYWDGVCNMASKFMDVADDRDDYESAMDSITEFADRLSDAMHDALEEENDG